MVQSLSDQDPFRSLVEQKAVHSVRMTRSKEVAQITSNEPGGAQPTLPLLSFSSYQPFCS